VSRHYSRAPIIEQLMKENDSKPVSRKLARKLIYGAVLNCVRIKAAAIENVDKLLRER
jgi:hypothetical protein